MAFDLLTRKHSSSDQFLARVKISLAGRLCGSFSTFRQDVVTYCSDLSRVFRPKNLAPFPRDLDESDFSGAATRFCRHFSRRFPYRFHRDPDAPVSFGYPEAATNRLYFAPASGVEHPRSRIFRCARVCSAGAHTYERATSLTSDAIPSRLTHKLELIEQVRAQTYASCA